MPAGRPRSFQSVEQLDEAVDGYLEWAEEKEKPLGVAGLAYYCGINRITLFRYAKGEYGEEYCIPIRRAMAAVESWQEENLLGRVQGSVAGIIFSLKNNFENWKDQQQVDHSGAIAVGEVRRTLIPAPDVIEHESS